MHFQLHPNVEPKYLYTSNDRSSTNFSLLDLEGSGQSTLFDMVPTRETSNDYEYHEKQYSIVSDSLILK